MRIDSIGKQNFGINPSNAVRNCMVETAMAGKDIEPLSNAMKGIYPYKFMTMLGDFKKVQGIGITNFFDSVPRMGKKLPEEFIPEFNKHVHSRTYYAMGRPIPGSYVDTEGKQIFEKHAITEVLNPTSDNNYIMLFSDKEGKPFINIVDIIVTKLQKIKEGFTPEQKIANEIEQQFPVYPELKQRYKVSQ